MKGVATAVPLGSLANRWEPYGSHEQFTALAQAAPIQFQLVPTGLVPLFPNATAIVSITPGDTADDVQVVAQNLPPNITFTCYFIQSATKPFGACQYCMDLITDSYGYGTTSFHGITTQAYAMIAESAGTSQNEDGPASGTQLEHFGMWFSKVTDAQTVLQNPALTGTPFDDGTPPAHAGLQAMSDNSPTAQFQSQAVIRLARTSRSGRNDATNLLKRYRRADRQQRTHQHSRHLHRSSPAFCARPACAWILRRAAAG